MVRSDTAHRNEQTHGVDWTVRQGGERPRIGLECFGALPVWEFRFVTSSSDSNLVIIATRPVTLSVTLSFTPSSA